MNSRKIDEEELRRDWQPLHGKVFGHAFLIDYCWTEFKTPFSDDQWEMVLLPHQFVSATYATFYEKFRNDNSSSASNFDAWLPFFQTLRDIDDTVFIIMQSWEGGVFPSNLGAEFVYDLDGEFDDRNAGSYLYYTGSAAFGRSGKWGALCDIEEMTLVGGDTEFMASLKKHSGGLGKIQKRYTAYAPDILISDREVEMYKILCRKIGWPDPVIDHG